MSRSRSDAERKRMMRHGIDRFPTDPTVVGNFGGGAPDGHPRRCQSRNRLGEQCKRYATRGRRFCKFHGGHQPLIKGRQMARYAKQVSKPLAEELQRLADESPGERTSLAEEVDLSRTLTARALTIFDKIVINDEKNRDGESATVEQKMLAQRALRDALDSTAALVEKMARVSALTKDKVTVEQIAFVVAQIGKILDAELEDEKVKERILAKLNKIAIPTDVSLRPKVVIDFGDNDAGSTGSASE